MTYLTDGLVTKWLIVIVIFFHGINCNVDFKIEFENNTMTNDSYIQYSILKGRLISTINAVENDQISFPFKIVYSITSNSAVGNVSLTCKLDEYKVGYFNWTDIPVQVTDGKYKIKSFNITLRAKRLGGSFLLCGVNYYNQSEKITKEEKVLHLIVQRIQTKAELAFRIIVMILLIFIVFVMGCALDRKIVWGYIKKPISPAIGFSSQYFFMPLIAFGIAKLSGIDNAFGLGLLTIGCSPGGGASNIWTVLLHGDLNLSMTMTFLSTVAALFMMPLWLFLLGRFFIDPKSVSIPFGNIMITLLEVIVPVAFGILFRYKCEEKAIMLAKKVKIVGLLFLIFILTYGTYANLYIYKLMGDYPYLIPIGACLPWTGFIFGTLLAFICRQTKAQCITVGLETGFQNIGIAVLILKFSIPQPGGDLGATMPIIVALLTPVPIYLLFIGLTIRRKCCKKAKDEKDNNNNEEEIKEDKKDEYKMKSKDDDEQKRELMENDNNSKVLDSNQYPESIT